MAFPSLLTAQEPTQNQDQPSDQVAAPQAPTGPLAIVRGVVRNAATGGPLPRALVRIDGDASTGALTDGDGRFAIPGVPIGPQEFEVLKPGFLDEIAEVVTAGMWENARDYAHNVIVAAEMPEVAFAMSPANSIDGQILLSTGDPAQGIGVVLLRRVVQSGRLAWQVTSTARTNSEGTYRFGGLADGLYTIYSEPAMESEPATNLVESGSAGNVVRNGYASQFYTEARDLAGAAKIQLAGGDQAEANLSLTLEPFHSVMATVFPPGGGKSLDDPSNQTGTIVATQIMDVQGHQLPYSAQYDQTAHTVETMLPDGNYTLAIAASTSMAVLSGKSPAAMGVRPSAGTVDFSVAGHAIGNLRVPLTTVRDNPIQVTLVRTGTAAVQSGPVQGGVFISLSQTGGWITDGMVSTYAEGSLTGPLDSTNQQPGSYWAHTSIADKRICEGSLTAGGANLAREPLVLGITGPAAPLSLTLRDDCATLKLALPGGLSVPTAGEEPFYTVYAIPDFDSTVDVVPLTLRPSTGGTFTLTGLTPGNYHIYTFDKPVVLAYRNSAAMAALANPGQAVTLSPGSQSDLVLEVPER